MPKKTVKWNEKEPISGKQRPSIGPTVLGTGLAAEAARKARDRNKRQKEILDKT